MASINWITNSGTGDWNTGTNWSSTVPTISDDATIGVSGTIGVTINAPAAANSLTVSDINATVAVNSALTIGTTLTNDGTLDLNSGGTIVGGTIIGGGFVFNRGTLSGVDYVGTLDASATGSHLTIANGITLTSTGAGPDQVLLTGASSYLDFVGSQTLSNAAVSIGSTAGNAFLREMSPRGVLTLAQSTTVTQTGVVRLMATGAGSTIVNAGTIQAGASAKNFYVSGSFTNQGVFNVSNGAYLNATNGVFLNAAGGSLSIGTNSTAALNSFANQGTITLGTAAILHLSGSFNQTTVGALTNSDGTVFIDGTLDNSDVVLSTGSASSLGTINLAGTIVGGTITGGAVEFNRGTLSGVDYVGPVDESASFSHLTIANGITLTPTGAGPDQVLLTGVNSYLDFVGSQTLSNAAVSIGGTSGSGLLREMFAGAALTLAPSTTLTQTGVARLVASGAGSTIVNAGTVQAGMSASSFYITGTFVNQGAFNVANGSYLIENNGVFLNATGGSLSIGTNSKATLSSFSNQGTITLGSSAILHLSGSFNQPTLGALTNSGGTVFIDGTLDNTGSVLSTGSASNLGTVNLTGTIVGGTLSGGGIQFNRGTLSGVNYVGTLDESATGSHLTIANGITLTPAGVGPDQLLLTGVGSYLDFVGSQTLSNAAVSLGGTSGNAFLREMSPGAVLTLAPSVTVTQAGVARFVASGTGSTIVNAGTVQAGASARTFYVFGTFTNQGAFNVSNGAYLFANNGVFLNAAGGSLSIGTNSKATLNSFSNQGTITLGGSANLHLSGSFNQPTIGALTNTGGTVFIDGTLDNTGSVLSTGTASTLGTVNLTGTIVGGTITGGGIQFNRGTLSGVNYVGTLDESAPGSHLTIANGITLTPAGVGPDQLLLTGVGSYLDFVGSQTLSNAAVSLGGTSGNAFLREMSSGAVLTLAPSITVTQTGVARFVASGTGSTIVNAGAVQASVSARNFYVFGTFANQGAFNVSNGAYLSGNNGVFLNAASGSLSIGANSTAALNSFSNQGTITLGNNAILHLSGSFNQPTIGALTNSGGTVFIDGTLNNTGSVLSTGTTSTLGTVNLTGTIVGGTITGGGIQFNRGTLSGVNYVGTLDESATGSHLTIANGITLTPTGAAPDPLLLTGSGSYLDFVGSQTLSNAAVSIGNTSANAFLREMSAGAVLTIAPSTTVTQSGVARFVASGTGSTIVNAGTVQASISARNFYVFGTFSNQGAFYVSNHAYLAANGGVFLNASGGLLSIGTNAAATLNNFSNQGTITLSGGGGLHLLGLFTQPAMGALTNSGGTIFIDGTLNNTGSVLSTGTASSLGTLNVTGTIVGGTITGGALEFNRGTLSGVNYVGTLDESATSSHLTIANGITLTPTGTGLDQVLLTGAGSYLDFVGSQTLSNAAVSIGSTISSTTFLREMSPGAVLTLAPSTTLTQTGLTRLIAQGTGSTIVNAGTIRAGALNNDFYVFGSFTNQGVINVANADLFQVQSIAGTGTVNFSTGGLFTAQGSVGSGQTFNFTDRSGKLTIAQPGSFAGTITGFRNGATIDLQSIGTATSYSYNTSLHQLTLRNALGSQIAQLSLSTGSLINPQFTLSTDFASGTLVTVQGTSTGTLVGSYGNGLLLANPTLQNPTTLSATAFVGNSTAAYGRDAVYGTNAAAWTLSNYGTIDAAQTGASGVYFAAGGTVNNNGAVSGVYVGVNIHGAAGVVTNTGTVTGTTSYAVALRSGGLVSNSGRLQALTTNSSVAAVVVQGSAGTVLNIGTIAAPSGGLAVWLQAGGYIDNGGTAAPTALLQGGGYGVLVQNAAGTVFNNGTIVATSNNSIGVSLSRGGTVGNSGTILGGVGVNVRGGGGTVSNTGLIQGTGTSGTGVYLQQGGVIVNSSLITGYRTGVSGQGAAVTLVNNGNVRNTATFGAAVSLGGGGLVRNNAVILGGGNGIVILGATGTVINAGQIGVVNTAGGYGVALLSGGYVYNAAGRQIAAGVYFGQSFGPGLPSTLINAGTVSKTNGIAVNLGTAGGLVVNEGSAALISGSRIGVALLPGTGIATGAVTIDNSGLITGPVAIQTSATTFIDNFGTIAATATAVNATGIAIGGGIVTNEAGGLIDGASGNAVTTNTAGVGMTLVNLGTVRNAATSASTVYLGHGGAVINGASGAQSALLSGSRNVVSFASVTGFAGTVDNFGTILSTGVTAGNGIYMGHGGLVTNRAGALITSPRNGVNIQNAAGTLINFGTVAHTGTGTQGDAVQLGAGGTVVNYGLLTGGHVSIYGAPNTIGSVVNIQGQPGTVRNLGTILATSTDSHGVELLDGGTLINGATNNSSALIEAGRRGVYIGGTFGIPTAGALGLVFNYGTIANTNTTAAAIEFTAGGTLTNYGLILSPRTGVNFSDSAGTVINNGLIASTAPLTATGGSGIYLQIGGQITNQAGGVVSAVRAAISIGNTTTTAGSVTIANAGSLIGATGIAIGAYDSGAANIVNTGAITGTSGSGIRFGTGPSTLTNAGTIIGGGGTAVAFAGGGRLIVDPGAVFSGAVLGGAGGSTLELAGTAPGTLSGVGGSISGFGQITVDSGAAWSLAGGTTLAVGGTLSDFGSLAITGSLVDGGTIQIEGTAGLILANGATGGGVIAFVGSGGRLEIDGSVMPTLPVNGFGAGDTIDLPGLGFSGVAPVLQGTTLILTGTGGVSDTLTLTGLVAHTQLSTANDGHGGTVLKGTTVPGLITGTYTNGLSLSNPAQNPATLTNNALVTYGGAGYARALYARSGTAMWTITNDGTVIGNPTGYVTGIGLGSPGIVINGAPGITNALIAGGQNGISTGAGAQSGPSTVVNYGTIASTGSNGGVGVQLGHGGLLVNDGLISAGHYAVYIGGNRGTHYAGATGTVINDGTMLGGKYTVVALQAGGTVENYGTIAATNTAVRGIQLLAGGSIVNHGVIAGSATGIYATSATGRVTIANYGTIVGANGTAVSLGSGQETLILGLGSVLLGSAGSAGIVKGLLAGDVLDFRGIAGATASVGANNLLSVSGGGVSATLQLDPTQNFTSDTFAAVADGAGGTALTLNVPGTVGFGQTLVVSGLVSGITVLSGGTLEVASGGTVVNTVVTNGGLEIVDAGGTDLSGTLQSGGSEDVFGSAFNTLLIKGGSMTVEAGGFTQAVVLDDAAVQSVSGLAIGTVVSVSDSQSVASGGLASNSVISGGSVIVTSGGNARGAVLVTGSETISAGGIDVGATLSGGTQDVFGRAEGALVKAGASQIVEAGGSTSATVLGGAASRFNAVQDFSIANGNPNGVWSYTASGALLTQPTPGSVFGQSGTNYWFNGQSQPQAVVIGQNTTGSTQTYASRVVPTDQLVLDPQGVADASVSFKAPTTGTYQISGDFTGLDTQEHAHPVEIRLNGTDVFSNTIASFGQTDAFNLTLSLNAGDILAFAVDTGPNGDFRDLSTGLNVTIATGLAAGSGGSQDVRSNGTASGTVVGNGGTEIVEAGGITSNTVIAGGLVDLQSGSRASGSILFTAAGGVLVVDSTTGPAAVISGLSRSATIDLRGITSASGDTVAFNSNAQTVTVTSGGVSEVLQVAGVAAGTAFRLGDDGAGGVLLHEVPPAPAGLGLISASDSGIVGDDITNVSTPTVSGTGEAGIAGGAGDTVTLLAGSTIVASATVQANGTWSATTSSLADGTYQLSAFETDAQGNASALSAPLAVTIDTVPPSTVADILTVLASAGATPLRIVAPSDGANPAGALSIKLTGLPSNGTVTLADGTTPVTAGESLSVAQLTGLDFTPASSATGTTSALTYTVADPAGNTASGAATIGVASATNPTSLYDFVFTYNDGKDYYLGAVADDGSHVQVGETLTTGLGTYTVFANAGVTALPVGTVSVSTYSHNGIGEGSPVPLKTAQGQPDGTAGLGSEADAVSGTDGLPHAFSPTQEASFTTTALYGFVFTYADNKEFYTGTVADDGSFGTTVGTRNITNGAGQLVGNYTVFAEGVTTRVSGSVTVDRFSAGDASLVPSAVSGSAGLGSESGTLTINGAATSFSPIAEPALSIAFQPVTPTAPPSQQTVIQNEVTVLYSEVLGRSPPDASGLATFSTAIANGMSLAAVRQTLANSPEAQNHLNQLYLQTFDRVADTGGLATYTQLLANGETMEAVQAILGTSAEAQTDINQLYLSVLARAADPGGLATYTGVLATGFADLDGVRSILAHSPEAISDLTSLFQSDIGRAPSAAELFGMEDQLGASTGNGASQTTIDAALKANGNAGGFTTITPPTGSASLTAAPNTPTLFAFDNIAFGQDTIAGFDPARDTLEISSALAANLATIKTDTTSANGNTIITLNTNQSITLNGVSPSNLSNPNFIFKPTSA